MTVPTAVELRHLARKGLDFAAREVGQAPEQRQARRLSASTDTSASDGTGPRILFLTPRDWAMHVQLEGSLALALRHRGASVKFLTCGGGLDICDRINVHQGPPLPCRSCKKYVDNSLDAFGMPHTSLTDDWRLDDPGDWPELDELGIAELGSVVDDGLPLGELLNIPTRWFLLSSRLEQDPLGADTYRAFLKSARRIARGFRQTIARWRPDTVVMLNGLFSFEAVARAICEEEGIDVVTYERTHRKGALVFARNAPANRYDLSGIWAHRGSTPLTANENAELDEYLSSRRQQGHPLLNIWKDAVVDRPERPERGRLVALFSNVTWDSSVLGRDVGFDSMHHWLDTVVDYFAAHPEHRLIMRAHPAETKRPGKESREAVSDHLLRRPGGLPDNIALIGPDDPTSSYPIMEEADLGLVYTSTVGIEMAVMDKPVLVGGRSHYRGLGFTNDPDTPEHFVQMLDELLADPAAGMHSVPLARQYAYAFFFDAPISVPLVEEPIGGLARLTVEDGAMLEPGKNADVDRICDGILGRLPSDLANRYFLRR